MAFLVTEGGKIFRPLGPVTTTELAETGNER